MSTEERLRALEASVALQGAQLASIGHQVKVLSTVIAALAAVLGFGGAAYAAGM
jgi:uncharacterized coiled-coil protein SlyX